MDNVTKKTVKMDSDAEKLRLMSWRVVSGVVWCRSWSVSRRSSSNSSSVLGISAETNTEDPDLEEDGDI